MRYINCTSSDFFSVVPVENCDMFYVRTQRLHTIAVNTNVLKLLAPEIEKEILLQKL